MQAVIPHFKGDVPPPSGPDAPSDRRLFEAAMTGRNPDDDRPLTPDAYLQVLRFVAERQSAVAQNVARVFAASLVAEDVRRKGEEARLFFLEGCTWDWGTKPPRTGAEVSAAMYGVVPHSLRAATPHVEALTRRTRDEFVEVLRLAELQGAGAVTTVTHGYHAFRTRRIGNHIRRLERHTAAVDVVTPGHIAASWERTRGVQPAERFLIDAIRIGEPTLRTNVREGIKELGPLLAFHEFERLTGIDLEKKILERMAVRQGKGADGDLN